MDEVWVILEQREAVLNDVSWELVSQGREIADKLNQRLCAVVIGSDIAAVGKCLDHSGVDEAYLLDNPNLDTYSCELYTHALSRLIEERAPQIVLWSTTPNGSDFASRVAAKLRTGLVSNCVAFDLDEQGLLLQTKPSYGGKVCSTIISPNTKPQLTTVRPGIIEIKGLHSSKKVKVTKISPHFDINKFSIRVADFIKADPLTLSLEEAEVIVAGGRGAGSDENFGLLEELAKALGGVVAGSRIAVDNRWVPREKQVGQSGKTVKPRLYIACGISGSSHHILGMKDSETIVAINTDPDAPIFKVADMGIVGDLLEVVPALTDEIRRRKEVTKVK